MTEPKSEAKDFFNSIAANYKGKYTARDAFHQYFFNERLEEATRGFCFKGKTILDIGAGTGDLYDFLLKIESDIDYYASDIAANMLGQSLIPNEKRFVGKCYEINFPEKFFDYIFLLGVTTYLDAIELSKTLSFINSSLNADGRVIITFTNQDSLDWKFRKFFKTAGRSIIPKTYVLSQEFQLYPQKLTTLQKTLDDSFEIEEIRWLNHTIFPFNQFLKNISVKAARKLHQKKYGKNFFNLFSSDYLLVLRKK